jgi:PAS domain S-box-containing protein
MNLFMLPVVSAVIPTTALVAAVALAWSRGKAARALRASEEKFSTIFQTSPDAINLASLDEGICLDLNDSYVNLFGHAREEAIGRSVLPGDLGIWVSLADRERFVEAMRASGQVAGFEATLRRKDGTVFTGLVSSSVVVIGGTTCNLSITRDITERKRAEEALRESAQRLELAARTGSLGIWDRNLKDDSLVWNDRTYEIYGLDRQTFNPTHAAWWERVLPEDRPSLREQLDAAFASPGPRRMAFRTRTPSGEVRHLGANCMVIRDEEGRPVRMIGVLRDRTEQVRSEAEHRQMLEERQHSEKLESLGSLAGGIAHDMNNVLTGILGNAERLQQVLGGADEAAAPLEAILHATGRGRDMVRALTDFARKGLTEPQRFDFNELVRREVDLINHATLEKVQVELDLDLGLAPALGDPSALGAAIMNLGVNALDAMPDGGKLVFRTRALGGDIHLSVADTGAGMTPEVLSRAMEPFFTTKPVGKGTGLGLARVYGTMKAHGGSVEIHSAPGRGTTIHLRLPGCRQPGAGPVPAQAPAPGAAALTLRILLVDDDPMILESIPPLLGSLGHQVATAARGEEAVALVAGGLDVDLVILDHHMPGLSDTQTLAKLRESRPGLPVVLASGSPDAQLEAQAARLGGVTFLAKPYRLRDLQKVLGEAWADAGA